MESAPKHTEYEALEKVGLKLAKQLGMTPAQFQEAVWVGAGGGLDCRVHRTFPENSGESSQIYC